MARSQKSALYGGTSGFVLLFPPLYLILCYNSPEVSLVILHVRDREAGEVWGRNAVL